MTTEVLIFDIGGTVFDWSAAVIEALASAAPGHRVDATAFAFDCRKRFMEMNGDVIAGRRPWMTADDILAAVMQELCDRHGLAVTGDQRRLLETSWQRMPAWPGAREAIAALRTRYIVAPLTILSFSMAVGSSRRNGIDWDSILSCDILGVYKPDPRCFERATEIVRRDPRQIMMVAAHPSDVRAGVKAGYRSAYVMPRLEDPGEDYADTGFAAEFDIVASDFADLTRKLGVA
jgi:2-haloacid dehalogenase